MDQTQKLNAPIRKHIFLIVAGILLLLLAAAAGFDWQISQTIGNMNDPFAHPFSRRWPLDCATDYYVEL